MAQPQDVSTAQEMYDAYVAAEKAILTGQSYSIGGRALTRADLTTVAAERLRWGKTLDRLTDGRTAPRVTRVVIRDN